jgi:methionyl aminopeptidase
MIIYKTPKEIEEIRKASQLAASVVKFIEGHIRPGITTNEINDLCHGFITEHGATPSCLHYKGYPKSICTSVNHVVCHGIPDSYRLREGDIVSIDISTYLNGFHGDTCKTFAVGKVSRAARDLLKFAEEALWIGIEAARTGTHLGDIGFAIQSLVEKNGYSVVKEYCGHGIGRSFHEDPAVVHFGRKGTGPQLKTGMVFTIEPMINAGKPDIVLLDDDWTVETEDRKLSAQFEHTVAITESGLQVLTEIPT